ncbi:MAG TPA: hypothetical protein VMI75_28025 [Polyangiaceae bacterium]|nr:hypothetical protein [Polyangiaceae bacterium]
MLFAAAYVLADTAYAGTATLSDRFEVRGRDTAGVLGVDLADVPTAKVVVTNRRWAYQLDYSALAMLPDVELGISPQLLQSADLGVSWRNRRVRIGVTEYATYGQENSTYLLGGPATTVVQPLTPTPVGGGTQLLAQPATLLYGSSRTVLASELVLSRRWSGTASIEYSMQGGLDAPSRLYLPLVSGPRADATATYALTQIDALETRASALESTATSSPCSPVVINVPTGASCDPSAQEVLVTETWRHRLSRTWTSALGAGASFLRGRLRDTQPYEQFVYPVGSASVERATGPLEKRNVIRLQALVTPVLDVRIGVLDERGLATFDISQRFGNTMVSGGVAAAHSIESPLVQPATTFQTTLETDVRLSPIVSVGGGIRYAWQEQAGLGAFSGGFVFAGVTVSAPEIRF